MTSRSTLLPIVTLATVGIAASILGSDAARADEPDPRGYELQCRGVMPYEVKATDNRPRGGSMDNVVTLNFSAIRYNQSARPSMTSGSCAWLDRGLNSSEPRDFFANAYIQEEQSVLEDIRACFRESDCRVTFRVKRQNTAFVIQMNQSVKVTRGTT